MNLADKSVPYNPDAHFLHESPLSRIRRWQYLEILDVRFLADYSLNSSYLLFGRSDCGIGKAFIRRVSV
jgi:hypothetical protein